MAIDNTQYHKKDNLYKVVQTDIAIIHISFALIYYLNLWFIKI